jgi:hypothetical protein
VRWINGSVMNDVGNPEDFTSSLGTSSAFLLALPHSEYIRCSHPQADILNEISKSETKRIVVKLSGTLKLIILLTISQSPSLQVISTDARIRPLPRPPLAGSFSRPPN